MTNNIYSDDYARIDHGGIDRFRNNFSMSFHLINLLNIVLISLFASCSSTKKESFQDINPRAIELNNQVSKLLQEESLFRGVFPNDSLLHKALNLVDQSIDCDSTYALAYSNKATILCRLGQYKKAIISLEQAAELQPDYAEVIQAQGFIYEKLGQIDLADNKYQEALIAFNNRLEKDPDNVHILTGKTFLLLFTEGKDAALAEINKIIKKYPDNNTPLIMRRTISLFNRQEFIANYN
jgi:tetratricopeptide (TPR) repeat protein